MLHYPGSADALQKTGPPDISADPFHERRVPASRTRVRLLGGNLSLNARPQNCDASWIGPMPVCRGTTPRSWTAFPCATRTRATHRRTPPGDAPRIEMLSGAGLLCGTTSSSDVRRCCLRTIDRHWS